jgi:hypothetical protein
MCGFAIVEGDQEFSDLQFFADLKKKFAGSPLLYSERVPLYVV